MVYCQSCRLSCQHNFRPSFLVLFGFVFCMFDSFLGSFPVNTFLLPSHAVYAPSSTSPTASYDVKYNLYLLHIIFDESDFWYGVTDRHRLSMNGVWVACEHNQVGLAHTHPITVKLCLHDGSDEGPGTGTYSSYL